MTKTSVIEQNSRVMKTGVLVKNKNTGMPAIIVNIDIDATIFYLNDLHVASNLKRINTEDLVVLPKGSTIILEQE